MDNGSKVFNQARIRHILPLCPQYTQRWSPFRFSNHRLPKATPTIKLKTRPDKVWLRPLCPQRTRLRSAITPLFDSDICQFYVPPSLLLLTSSNIQEDPALLLQCPSAAYTDQGRWTWGGGGRITPSPRFGQIRRPFLRKPFFFKRPWITTVVCILVRIQPF